MYISLVISLVIILLYFISSLILAIYKIKTFHNINKNIIKIKNDVEDILNFSELDAKYKTDVILNDLIKDFK